MAGNVVTSASASAGALIGRRVHWGSSEEDLRTEDGSNSINGDQEVAGGGGKGEDRRQKRRVYSSNSATCLDRNNNNNINNNRRDRKTSIPKGSEQRGLVMQGAETQGTDPRGPRTTLPRVSEPGESEPGGQVQSEVNAEHNVNRDDEPQEAERKDRSSLSSTRTRNECVPIRIVNTIIMFLCFSAFIVGMMVTLYREAMRIDDKNHRITTTTTTPRPHAA